jgi:NTE family protein
MRSVLETTALVRDLDSTFLMLGATKIEKLVYLMVSTETAPDLTQYTLNEIPGLSRMSRALIDIPINRYSMDPMQLMNRAIQQWRVQLQQRPEDVSSVFAPDADIYFINTSLALTDDEVDHLLLAGSRLLRNNQEFQRLTHDLGSEAGTTPMPSVTSPTP